MRLFIPTGIFHPESGGPATYLHALLPEARAAGHAIRLLTFGDPTPQDGDYGYPVQRVPRGSLALRPLAYAAYGLAAREPLAWADLIYQHTTGLPLVGPRSAPRVIKIVGDQAWERCIRLGLIPPTEDIDAFQTRRYSPLVNAIKASRARDVRATDHVIVPSQYLKQMVMGWGMPEEKITVIYNALSKNAASTRSSLSREQARAALKLPEQEPILLCVARLAAWKGIGPLIRAVAATPGVRLIVAGDGPLLAELQAIAAGSGAAERVQLLGRVPREQIAVLLRAADYTVLYSGYEGLSHTLLESLHAGTPVIASAKGGNPEVVLEGVNGLLVPYHDEDALTECVRAAVQPGLRERLAAGTGEGLDRFMWERLVRETLGRLEQLAAG